MVVGFAGDVALVDACPVLLGVGAAGGVVGEEGVGEAVLDFGGSDGGGEGGDRFGGGSVAGPDDAVDVGSGRGFGAGGAGDDEFADEGRRCEDDLLDGAAAHAEAEEVDGRQAESAYEGDGVVGPALEGSGDGARAAADAGVVEDDDGAVFGEAVDQ